MQIGIIQAVKVFTVACAGALCAQLSIAQVRVLVDQVGYEPKAPKEAIVSGSNQDQPRKFALINADSGKTVFHGTAPSGQQSSPSGSNPGVTPCVCIRRKGTSAPASSRLRTIFLSAIHFPM